jgi:hypothetical protein
MKKCGWCEERTTAGTAFCDDLCERLYNDYWASRGPWHRYADQERARKQLVQKKNKVRSG